MVLSLSKVSVGSVLKEGDPLVELATMNSPVQAEIQIGARDVGFVRPGDEATIKFDAFQFVEHGAATGRLLGTKQLPADGVEGISAIARNGRVLLAKLSKSQDYHVLDVDSGKLLGKFVS